MLDVRLEVIPHFFVPMSRTSGSAQPGSFHAGLLCHSGGAEVSGDGSLVGVCAGTSIALNMPFCCCLSHVFRSLGRSVFGSRSMKLNEKATTESGFFVRERHSLQAKLSNSFRFSYLRRMFRDVVFREVCPDRRVMYIHSRKYVAGRAMM